MEEEALCLGGGDDEDEEEEEEVRKTKGVYVVYVSYGLRSVDSDFDMYSDSDVDVDVGSGGGGGSGGCGTLSIRPGSAPHGLRQQCSSTPDRRFIYLHLGRVFLLDHITLYSILYHILYSIYNIYIYHIESVHGRRQEKMPFYEMYHEEDSLHLQL